MAIHLKYYCYSNYSHEKVVFSHPWKYVELIWFSSIELIEYLSVQGQNVYSRSYKLLYKVRKYFDMMHTTQ